jgi:hypothetical protein
MKDFLLETFPNPERKGCPDDKTLEALAQDRLPAEHPARLHVGSCSECYAEYRHYRLDWEESKAAASPRSSDAISGPVEVMPSNSARVTKTSRLRAVALALAASLIVVCGGGVWEYNHLRAQQNAAARYEAASIPVNAQVDLFDAGTLRGADDGTNQIQEVTLPAAIVHLSITLPRFSEDGQYEIVVSKDKAGRQVVAESSGDAKSEGGKVDVNVTLDLRTAKPGAYFLATVRGADNGMYYYPLKIN